MPFQSTALTVDDFPPGQSRTLVLGEHKLALFHTAQGFFALDELCPHRGAPLHDGFVHEGVVTCPWHQWNFQLSDGVCRNIPGAKVRVFPVEVRAGTIWVDV